MANKVFLRKVVQSEDGPGVMASERLDFTVDLEKGFPRCFFSFTSRVAGVANMYGSVNFDNFSDSSITHSSGALSMETMTNFNSMDALLDRLVSLCKAGKTEKEIFADDRIRLIMKNNNFIELETA